MSDNGQIFCGDETGGKLCGVGPLGMAGQGPAYAYGPNSKLYYAQTPHFKCEKHHLRACRLSTRDD